MKPAKLKLLLWSLLLACGVLRAHTHLETAVPADGAVLKTAPSILALTFGEDVQLLKVDVIHTGGAAEDIGFEAVAAAAKTFAIPLPALAPSTYTVNWTVLGADGHRVDGHFGFTVDPSATESAGAAAEHPNH